MDRSPETMSVKDLSSRFYDIDFPEYQREPDIWSRDQKQRLIDSVLRGFDIASIYMYRRDDDVLECIDGRQRLNAFMSFLGENETDESDNGFPVRVHNEISSDLVDEFAPLNGRTFADLGEMESDLARRARETVLNYEMTVVYLSGAHEPDEFNLQFLRLNLGTLINAGEKLHAMVGGMRNILFLEGGIGKHEFFEHIRIPTRRYAREQVAAQILIQAFAHSETEEFTRARHLDLQRFLKAHSDTELDDPLVGEIGATLDWLATYVDELGPLLRNRAMTVTVVLLAWRESLHHHSDLQPRFVEFVREFIGRLQWQVENMKNYSIDPRYEYLVEFQRQVTQASVERPAVTRRHQLLLREWKRWLEEGALTGDEEYAAEEGEDPPRVLPDS